jgi:alpha-glucosidase
MFRRTKKYFLFFLLLLATKLCAAGHLDTLNGNLYIYLERDYPSFIIPLSSINTEPQKIRYTSKYGSHEFKRKKQVNKTPVKVLSLNNASIALSDGNSVVRIVLIDKYGHPALSIEVIGENELQFSILTDEQESIYGGGIRYDSATLNSSCYVNVSEENGIGRGDRAISNLTKLLGIKGERHSTYYPVPFFYSSRMRGVFVDTDHLFFADFAADQVQFKLFNQHTEIVLFEGSDYHDLISQFSVINGRGIRCPDWATGTILGVQAGTEEVLKKLEMVRTNGATVDALWIQDWVGKRETAYGSRLNWTWEPDTTMYPSIRSLREKSRLPVLGYINPFFVANSPYADEGLAKGFLLKNKERRSGCFDFGGIDGYMLDVFQEDARKWMKEIIQNNLVENGFSGWMADFGEWFSAENMTLGQDDHNRYLSLWIQLNHEIVNASTEELFFFHRSGLRGSAHHSQLSWLGDQTVDYGMNDGLPSVITAMQSSGLTGLPPVHSDVGGYTALKVPFFRNVLRTEEVMLDWMRLEAFTPVFRTHEGLLPEDCLQVYSSDTMAQAFAFFSQVHRALQPYFESCLQDYRTKGIPLFRHPILMNQLPDSNHEVYVGPDIILAYSDQPLPNREGFVLFTWGENRLYVFIREHSAADQLLAPYKMKE